ncbi:hypothetical protein EY643_06630 [Halioglobus maricola]|uniref:KAP NTPase domain-containing protein n=1 Tax=Halioglobus maricola TaxID=2601894 RepID=A0A5P9NHT5_9GAMM|nr:P-loop NTPase fold protein [Halioglobus maricola]QFU75352.1 hypothetical protein EY643_06630 [Halioglobus maricola]
MKIRLPELEIPEDAGFSRDFDMFERKAYGVRLLDIIQRADDNLVIGLDAAWGEGKSTFISMWSGHLRQNDVPLVVYDAFTNDYQESAFIALASCVYDAIPEKETERREEFLSKATSLGKILLRSSARIATRAALGVAIDDSAFESASVESEGAALVDQLIASKIAGAQQEKEERAAFRAALSELAGSGNDGSKLVFVIDELDRCRPAFALEIIECVKHFFAVPGVSFVLVMNRTQVEESVRCTYGQGIDAHTYLQKFVNLWTALPSKGNGVLSGAQLYMRNCLGRMGFEVQTQEQNVVVEQFDQLIGHYRMTLREIEKALTNFAIVSNAINSRMYSHYYILTVFLAVLKVVRPGVYADLAKELLDYKSLSERAGLVSLVDEYWSREEGCYLRFLLCGYLGTDAQRESLSDFSSLMEFRRSENPVANIIKWMETLEYT